MQSKNLTDNNKRKKAYGPWKVLLFTLKSVCCFYKHIVHRRHTEDLRQAQSQRQKLLLKLFWQSRTRWRVMTFLWIPSCRKKPVNFHRCASTWVSTATGSTGWPAGGEEFGFDRHKVSRTLAFLIKFSLITNPSLIGTKRVFHLTMISWCDLAGKL